MDITPSSDVLVQNRTRVHQHEHKGLLEGIHFKFPTFKHEHPPVIDVNQVADESMTIGQKVADKVAGTMGSWRFIITQATIMVVWIMLNLVAWFYHWDIYPFVLLNLAMSAQAAFATPLIMMSQNRQSDKDRLTAQNDYLINCKGEEEVRNLMDHLDHQDTVLLQLVKRIEEQHLEIKEHLVSLDPTLVQKLGMDIVELSKESLEGDGEVTGNS
ncbi:MAG: DUF1003 domain-containing protein [Chloroflexi bacterium]|nr:MAG: DUF1003 domain-containing protein [Chloroflexota bacterium]